MATRQQAAATDVSSYYWVMRIEGEADSCQPSLAQGDTMLFGDTLSSASGDTIRVTQFGRVIAGEELLVDDYGNAYGLRGAAQGYAVMFTLAETGDMAQANGLGVLVGNQVTGMLTGQLAFDSGRVCELGTTTMFTADLVER